MVLLTKAIGQQAPVKSKFATPDVSARGKTMLSSFVVFLFPRIIINAVDFVFTRHRALLIGFVSAAALMLPALTEAQTTPQITIFLADPQLGVVGVAQGGGNTLFFEARTPAGSTMSTRLLDASGRTIAISGHSMDSLWLITADFDAADATQSLSLAASLPNPLSNALNPNVFPNELSAISNLALSAANLTAGTTAAVIDSPTANLATPSQSVVNAAASYDASAASALTYARDASGNLSATFGSTLLQTFVESFPNETSDDGTQGITEVSARLVASNGTSLIQQFGGDHIPDNWDNLMAQSVPTTSADTLQPFIEAGNAIRGGVLATRFSSIATSNETAALGQVAAALRDNGLLPQPAALAHASSSLNTSSTCGTSLNYVGLWAKSLFIVAQHSGTYTYHWYWNGKKWVPAYGVLFCNHGTCPYTSPMTRRCQYWSPPVRCRYRNPPNFIVPKGEPGAGGHHSCLTGYGLLSDFSHNCNDDSWTQIRAIKGEPEDPQNYRCHDLAPDPRAPGCNE